MVMNMKDVLNVMGKEPLKIPKEMKKNVLNVMVKVKYIVAIVMEMVQKHAITVVVTVQ